MSDIIEKALVGELKVVVTQDLDPPNPRTEYDHAGIIAAAHKRYNLADKNAWYVPLDLDGWDAVDEAFLSELGDEVIAWLPIYMIDHSGIALSTKPFSCPWDSGRIGIIYVTRKTAQHMGFTEDTTKEQILNCLRSEIQEFSDYLEGSCYGYRILDVNGEEQASCWGFFGSSSIALTNGINEAKLLIRNA